MSTTTVKEDGDWKDGEAASYDFVRFALCDMHGISRCKLITRRHVDEMLKSGITMCAGRTLSAYMAIYTAVIRPIGWPYKYEIPFRTYMYRRVV